MKACKLSVIVVSYNMARELPRTLLTLSPQMQRDIAPEDYEIIIVDNGSANPPQIEDYVHLLPNIRIHHVANPSRSPVRGINEAIDLARGELVGVMIDGARMASPRLLATALEAAALCQHPVIGTVAFHLGPDIQSRSIHNGYCQAVEDQLLASIKWEEDGYRLFDISVFAGSSAKGWLALPAETNALFLKREHWKKLGGYDEAFQTPGGGLANLDLWARLCTDQKVIMLLGETTFHQFHGGVATNATVDRWPDFHAEYIAIRSKPYSQPQGMPVMYGQIPPSALPSLSASVAEVLAVNAGKT